MSQHYMSCCYLLNCCNRLLLKRRNPRKRTSPGFKRSVGRATHWNVSCYNSLTNLLLPFRFVHGVLAPGHHHVDINWIMYDGNMAICLFILSSKILNSAIILLYPVCILNLLLILGHGFGFVDQGRIQPAKIWTYQQSVLAADEKWWLLGPGSLVIYQYYRPYFNTDCWTLNEEAL